MTPAEARRLLLDAEALLFERFDATADPTEKRSLRTQIEEINRLKDEVNFTSSIGQANALNSLSDVLVGAIAGIRSQPLNGIASRIEDLLGQIGGRLGSVAGELRGGSSIPSQRRETIEGAGTPARPDPAPTSPPVVVGSGGDNAQDREYTRLFSSCVIRPERLAEVKRVAGRLVAGAAIYKDVSDAIGGAVPWFFIGIVHGLEASFSFTTHLHNGDPLSARTIQEPPGRPATGSSPFTWKESATDAMRLKKFDREQDWSLPRLLNRWEAYNGFGYRKFSINSPYLWSFSDHYTKGKFVRDGVFDPEAVSGQCGAAVVLKHLIDAGVVMLQGRTGVVVAEAALGLQTPNLPTSASVPFAHARAEIEFPGDLSQGSRKKAAVRRVQEWCSFHCAATRIDEDFGSGTADAVVAFQQDKGIPPSGTVDARTWAALTSPMLAALAPLKSSQDPRLADLMLAAARQHLAQKPVELGGDNLGAWVRLYMAGKDGSAQKWCAGFVCFIIEQAAQTLGKPMPIPRQVGVDALVKDARKDGRFIAGIDLTTPEARRTRLLPGGCLFVLKSESNANDFIHTGIVTEAQGDSFRTIEGNTNDDGGVNGFEVVARSRSYKRSDFVILA